MNFLDDEEIGIKNKRLYTNMSFKFDGMAVKDIENQIKAMKSAIKEGKIETSFVTAEHFTYDQIYRDEKREAKENDERIQKTMTQSGENQRKHTMKSALEFVKYASQVQNKYNETNMEEIMKMQHSLSPMEQSDMVLNGLDEVLKHDDSGLSILSEIDEKLSGDKTLSNGEKLYLSAVNMESNPNVKFNLTQSFQINAIDKSSKLLTTFSKNQIQDFKEKNKDLGQEIIARAVKFSSILTKAGVQKVAQTGIDYFLNAKTDVQWNKVLEDSGSKFNITQIRDTLKSNLKNVQLFVSALANQKVEKIETVDADVGKNLGSFDFDKKDYQFGLNPFEINITVPEEYRSNSQQYILQMLDKASEMIKENGFIQKSLTDEDGKTCGCITEPESAKEFIANFYKNEFENKSETEKTAEIFKKTTDLLMGKEFQSDKLLETLGKIEQKSKNGEILTPTELFAQDCASDMKDLDKRIVMQHAAKELAQHGIDTKQPFEIQQQMMLNNLHQFLNIAKTYDDTQKGKGNSWSAICYNPESLCKEYEKNLPKNLQEILKSNTKENPTKYLLTESTKNAFKEINLKDVNRTMTVMLERAKNEKAKQVANKFSSLSKIGKSGLGR